MVSVYDGSGVFRRGPYFYLNPHLLGSKYVGGKRVGTHLPNIVRWVSIDILNKTLSIIRHFLSALIFVEKNATIIGRTFVPVLFVVATVSKANV